MDPRSGVKNYVRLSVFLERPPDRSRRSFVVWKRRSRLHTSLPPHGEGGSRQRRSGAFVCSTNAPLFPCTTSCLSCYVCPIRPLRGAFLQRGKTDDTRIASSHKTFGHRLIYICAASPFRMSRAGKALKCAKSGMLHGLP